jgi:hypothetical protein
MPTILRRDGFRFVIWLNDHLPPHVHIFKAGNELIVNLGIGGQLPVVRLNHGMSRSEENNALLVTALNNIAFLEHWEEIHGKVINDQSP